ncbi:MAG: hypothetical protein RLZZ15_3338 [Verrucomicrobiota bacterium]
MHFLRPAPAHRAHRLATLAFLVGAILQPTALRAGVVGTNPPALPLTADRINALPAAEQPAWHRYLAKSRAQRAIDQAFLATELKRAGLKESIVPPEARGGRAMPLREKPEWYATDDARRRATNLVTFQTPAGGWSKNFNPADHPRAPGEGFSHDNTSRFLAPGDNDTPADLHWSYIGTFDNGATITQLRFLAKVIAAAPTGAAAATTASAAWRASFARGVGYVLNAQYPNGGFPQTWPLDGGYHDAITFNDDAFANILTLLHDLAAGRDDFAFVAADTRALAAASAERGIACLLLCQIIVAGRRTGWGQQHDMLTLAPTSARNYEMPSISGGESAHLAIFLMSLEKPSAEIVAAVHGAAAWFEKTKLVDVAWRPAPDGSGRTLVKSPGAAPLWARYSEIGTDRPLFGDRDKSIHDDVNEISKERRNGYSWFGTGPKLALDHYAKWAKTHPR